jgi:hypothetical protein
MAMKTDLRLRSTLPRPELDTDLVVCSLCLRVLRGSEWVEAETVIRELRTYELEAPPTLHSAVCDLCSTVGFGHQEEAAQPAAA